MNNPKPFSKKKSLTSFKDKSLAAKDEEDKKSCVNMEELMQFEAARQRALAKISPEAYPKPFSEFVPYRIFINNVDTFNGAHFVRHFSQAKRETSRENYGESEFEEIQTDYTLEDDENDDLKDEKEINDEASHESEDRSCRFQKSTFEIIGTLDFINNPDYTRPEGILELLDNEKKSEFLEKVLSCGFIIYDITGDLSCHPKQIEEAKWVAESIFTRLENMEKFQPRAFSKYKDCRTFILISTLLTWAKTKPIDPEDTTLPFTEKDYRKRKPHPNYKVHCALEKRIIELGKKYPNHLRTIVLGSGVPYGLEEDIMHFYFKMAWQDAPHLPIFRPGTNTIPVIHIDSLCSILLSITEAFPQKNYYLIATDPQSVTLKEVVKVLAKNLGNGKTLMVSKEEVFLYPVVKQRNYDMLTANINIVPGFMMESPMVKWATDSPFCENILKLIEEFKQARGLLPVKIFIHGPPASGKTLLARRLSAYYDIPYLNVKGVIEDTIQNLKNKIESYAQKNSQKGEKIEIEGDEGGNDSEDYDDEEQGETLDELKQTLKEIEDNMDNENSRLDNDFVLKFFKTRMLLNSCQNKGYVLDGFPKTIELTKKLYEPMEEEKTEEVEEEEGGLGSVSYPYNAKIIPGYVESLDASDDFLIDRVIKMPEINVQNTRYKESEMCRRLTQFRNNNTEDNTPLIFYDELDIHPMIYNVENDTDPQMEPTFQAIIHHIGPPRNYENEESNFKEIEIQKAKIKLTEEMKSQRDEIRKATQDKRDDMEQWMFLKNQELEMEEKALLVMGMPLRHYLMKYIFPTLTRGLVEVARIRPDDPVDFLSEFLFRENPEGKMFQPNFEEREEKLAKAIREYESSETKGTSDKKSSVKSYSTEKSVRSDAVSKVSDYKCSLVSSRKVSTRTKTSTKSESEGSCSCQKSLSSCSSDLTPASATSCHCVSSESCEEEEVEDPCVCPCEKKI